MIGIKDLPEMVFQPGGALLAPNDTTESPPLLLAVPPLPSIPLGTSLPEVGASGVRPSPDL